MAGLNYNITADNSNFLAKMQQVQNSVNQTSQKMQQDGDRIQQSLDDITNKLQGLSTNIDTKGATQGMKQIQTSIIQTNQAIQQNGEQMNGMVDKMTGKFVSLAAQIGLGFSAVSFVKQVANVRGQFQQLEASFNTLLGSKEQADELMNQLVHTAAITPFDLVGVASGAKQLLAYGTSADTVNDKLIELGNIAAGLSLPLTDLVTLYGTTVSKDAMDTLDLKQFKSRGIAIDEAIAAVMEVDKKQVPAMISAHQVTGDIVAKAIKTMAGETGQFGGMMENQSKTIAGQIANIGDSIDMMFNNIGKDTEGLITGVLSNVGYIVENYESIGKAIAEVVVAFGSYKAVLASLDAMNNVAERNPLLDELESIKEFLPLKEQEANADVQAAVSKGILTEAEAQNIIAARANASAKMEELKATEAEAKAELESAIAARTAANAKAEAAIQAVALAETELQSKLQTGTQEEIQTALIARNNAERQKKVVLHEQEQAAIRVTTTATAQENATRAVNTLALQTETKAKGKAFTMTNLLSAAQKGLGSVMKATGLSMLANPYVAVAASVAALGYGIYKLITYQSDYEKAVNKMNDAHVKAQIEASNENEKLSKLCNTLKTAEKGSDDYKNAKAQIITQYGKYYNGLQNEIESLNEQGTLYKTLSKEIEHYYDVKAYHGSIDELETNYQKEKAETYTDVYNRVKKYVEENGQDYEKLQSLYNEITGAFESGDLKLSYREKDITEVGDNLSKLVFEGVGNISEEAKKILNERKTDAEGLHSSIAKWLFDLSSAREVKEQAKKEAKTIFGITDAEIAKNFNDETNNGNETLSNAKSLKETIETILELEKELNNLRNKRASQNGVEAEKTDRDIQSVQQELDLNKSSYKMMTGKEWGKDDKSRLKDNTDEEVKKLAERFKNLQKGTDKTYAQMVEDEFVRQLEEAQMAFDEEEAQINKLEADAKALNKKTKALTNESGLTEEQNKAINNAREANSLNLAKKEQDIEKAKEIALIAMYDEYEAKRLEISNKYAKERELQGERIAKNEMEQSEITDQMAQYEVKIKEGNIDEEGKKIYNKLQSRLNSLKIENLELNKGLLSSTENEANEIFKIDFSQFQGSEEYQLIFQDLENYSSETLNRIYTKFQELGAKLPETMSAKDMEVFYNEMNKLTDEMIRRDPFGQRKIALQEYKLSQIDVIERQKELTQAEQEENNALQEYNDAKTEFEDIGSDATEEQKLKALDKKTTAENKYNKARQKTEKATTELTKAEKKQAKSANDVQDANAEINNSLSKMFQELQNVGNAIPGLGGEIVSIIGNIGNVVMSGISGMQAASTAGAEAIKTVERASVILAIIGAALQIAQKIASLFTKESSAQIYERTSQVYENYISILDEVIDKNIELAKSAQGEAGKSALEVAQRYYEQATELVRKQQEASRQVAKDYLNSRERGEHSAGYNMVKAMSTNAIDDAAKALNMTYEEFQRKTNMKNGSRGVELLDLSTEQLVKLRENAFLFMAELDDDVRDAINTIVDGESKITEMAQTQIDNTTGYSLDDLVDDFKESLSDMSDEAEDFSKSFAEKLKDAIINDQINNTFKAKLKTLQDMQATMAQGGYTTQEYNDLMQEARNLDAEIKAEKERLMAQYNFEGDTEEQESTWGGFETMSEETGTELNGRFSAMYIVQSELLNQVSIMMQTINSSLSLQTDGNMILSDLRQLHAQTNTYLDTISKLQRTQYTYLVEKIDKLVKDIENL